MRKDQQPRRLSGETATLAETAFSGIIIRIHDGGDSVLIQDYRPSGDRTVYSNPFVREITYNEEGEAGFQYADHFYHLADFMRDNYPNF